MNTLYELRFVRTEIVAFVLDIDFCETSESLSDTIESRRKDTGCSSSHTPRAKKALNDCGRSSTMIAFRSLDTLFLGSRTREIVGCMESYVDSFRTYARPSLRGDRKRSLNQVYRLVSVNDGKEGSTRPLKMTRDHLDWMTSTHYPK